MENTVFLHTPVSQELLCEIREKIGGFICGKRLAHTYGVEEEALYIAGFLFPYFGIGNEYLRDVSASALLHDVTKQKSFEQQKALCEKYSIKPICSPPIIHSKTSAYFAREIFGINDAVFSAIFCHTTGREDMSLLDKIIFIADYTEKTRTAESCIKVRRGLHTALEEGTNPKTALDRAIISALKATIQYLLETDSPIDCETVVTLNFLLAEYTLQSQCTEE